MEPNLDGRTPEFYKRLNELKDRRFKRAETFQDYSGPDRRKNNYQYKMEKQ